MTVQIFNFPSNKDQMLENLEHLVDNQIDATFNDVDSVDWLQAKDLLFEICTIDMLRVCDEGEFDNEVLIVRFDNGNSLEIEREAVDYYDAEYEAGEALKFSRD